MRRVATTSAAYLLFVALAVVGAVASDSSSSGKKLRSEMIVISATDLQASASKAEEAAPPAPAVPKEGGGGPIYPQYRGVNLGGWLVLESWMYPEWWKSTGVKTWVGEAEWVAALGKETAKPLLEGHWDTWVTKEDLSTLAKAGIKHLRIPIGWWILGDEYLVEGDKTETYVPGGWFYLIRALGWAKELGLQAIIDLHGAPGVQNGHDNCGYAGGDTSIKWGEPEYQKRTLDVLVALAKNLTIVNSTAETEGTVLGLCLLNEPWTTAVGGPLTMDTVKQFAQTATDAVLAAGWKGHIWYPDGFNIGWDGWKDFLASPQYTNVFADTHIYMMFDPGVFALDTVGQTDKFCTGYHVQELKNAGTVSSGVVVGEYSLDYRLWPWDWSTVTVEQKKALTDLLLAQQKLYGVIGDTKETAGVGGFFWSFKSLGRVDLDIPDPHVQNNGVDNKHSPWNYLQLLADGIAPPDLATATYTCPAPATK